MGSGPSQPDGATPKTTLAVDLEAVAIWEPVGPVREGKATRKVAGLSVQSWDFRPPKSEAGASRSYTIVISENPQEYGLQDGALIVVGQRRNWTITARYIETLEFASADGSPRPKHFFEAKLPKDLKERLRESPEDILAKSDLFEGTLPDKEP